MLLSGNRIKREMAKGSIVITPFEDRHINPFQSTHP